MPRDLLIGPHAVREWLEADPGRIVEVLVARGAHPRAHELAHRAEAQGIRVSLAPADELTRLAGPRNHQGLVAHVRPFAYQPLDRLLEGAASDALWLAVDGVTDPGNFGNLLRSGAYFGATAVLQGRDKACPISPVVERSAAGAAARLPICLVDSLLQSLAACREHGFRIVATVLGAPTAPDAVDLRGRLVVVIGGEERGLRPAVRKAADAAVTIPGSRLQSLNVAAFAAAMLYEVARQRRTLQSGP